MGEEEGLFVGKKVGDKVVIVGGSVEAIGGDLFPESVGGDEGLSDVSKEGSGEGLGDGLGDGARVH